MSEKIIVTRSDYGKARKPEIRLGIAAVLQKRTFFELATFVFCRNCLQLGHYIYACKSMRIVVFVCILPMCLHCLTLRLVIRSALRSFLRHIFGATPYIYRFLCKIPHFYPLWGGGGIIAYSILIENRPRFVWIWPKSRSQTQCLCQGIAKELCTASQKIRKSSMDQ